MSAEIIPFDFEEQAVRVVMRGEEPWFVAADVCRVLDIVNTSDAMSRLDDDERMTLDTTEGQTGRGGARRLNIISESGLYALVLTSRKEQAKRFRKWITAEVIPSIRRTGRYEHPGLSAPVDLPAEGLEGLGTCAVRDAELWLSMIREARLIGGTQSAKVMWARSPLPPLAPMRVATLADPEDGRACLDHVLGFAVHGRSVAELIVLSRSGDMEAHRSLSLLGLRDRNGGLFIAQARVAGLAELFEATRWQDGRHRAALLAVPGARLDQATLMGIVARGVVVPVDLGADHA